MSSSALSDLSLEEEEEEEEEAEEEAEEAVATLATNAVSKNGELSVASKSYYRTQKNPQTDEEDMIRSNTTVIIATDNNSNDNNTKANNHSKLQSHSHSHPHFQLKNRHTLIDRSRSLSHSYSYSHSHLRMNLKNTFKMYIKSKSVPFQTPLLSALQCRFPYLKYRHDLIAKWDSFLINNDLQFVEDLMYLNEYTFQFKLQYECNIKMYDCFYTLRNQTKMVHIYVDPSFIETSNIPCQKLSGIFMELNHNTRTTYFIKPPGEYIIYLRNKGDWAITLNTKTCLKNDNGYIVTRERNKQKLHSNECKWKYWHPIRKKCVKYPKQIIRFTWNL